MATTVKELMGVLEKGDRSSEMVSKGKLTPQTEYLSQGMLNDARQRMWSLQQNIVEFTTYPWNSQQGIYTAGTAFGTRNL